MISRPKLSLSSSKTKLVHFWGQIKENFNNKIDLFYLDQFFKIISLFELEKVIIINNIKS